MRATTVRNFAIWATVGAALAGLGTAAQAEDDFFSALLGGSRGSLRVGPSLPLPFASENDVAPPPRQQQPRVATVSRQAYCVRTCDGRYFPISAGDAQSKAASCNNFCPASDTKVVFGSSIESAATETGKPYSEMPNAFKYRTEVVPGCTCNGKDAFGLAKIRIEDDPTMRKGDIVASANGLVVAHVTDRRHGEVNFSPASAAIRAKYERVPVVASE